MEPNCTKASALTDPSGTGWFWERSYIKNGQIIETPKPAYCPDVGMEFTPDHIVETQGKGPNDKFQLYNLRTDPGEKTNVFAQEPDKARELFAALKADIARGRSHP